MGHSVCYVVDVSGERFNSYLSVDRRATESDFKELIEHGALWDGKLAGNDMEFSAELTGRVTVLWLTTKYSRFLTNDGESRLVKRLEDCLKEKVGARRIVRMDELLLDQWEHETGELWFREAEAFDRILSWLSMQPNEEWSPVNPSS